MGRSPARLRRGRRVVALVSTAVCLVAVVPDRAGAARAAEERFAVMINEVRVAAGLPALPFSDRLSNAARGHSRQMAERGALFHLDLVAKGGGTAGHNVGHEAKLARMLNKFMRSSTHEKNILGHWQRTGVGVVRAGGEFWLTQIFRS